MEIEVCVPADERIPVAGVTVYAFSIPSACERVVVENGSNPPVVHGYMAGRQLGIRGKILRSDHRTSTDR
jgi:hypothetical protein